MNVRERLEFYLASLSPVARAYAHAYALWLESGRQSREPRTSRLSSEASKSIRVDIKACLTQAVSKEKSLTLPNPRQDIPAKSE